MEAHSSTQLNRRWWRLSGCVEVTFEQFSLFHLPTIPRNEEYWKALVRGEFAAIAAIRDLLPPVAEPGGIWIGDDAASVSLPGAPAPGGGGWMLLTADTAVAGVHADLSLTSLSDLGWKAVAAAVSDIAAMGGEPAYSLVTVSGPPGTAVEDLEELYRGVAAAVT